MTKKRNRYPINTFSIFVVLTLLYVVSISIEGIFGVQTTLIRTSREKHFEILIISCLVVLTVYLAYRFSWLRQMERSYSDPEIYRQYKRSNFNTVLAGMWFALILLGFLNFWEEFSRSFSSYDQNVTTTYEHSVFSFYKAIMYSFTAMLAALLIYTRNHFQGVALCLFLFMLGLLSYDKDPMVLGVLALVSSSSFYSRRYNLLVFIEICIGVLFLAFLSRVYSYYRGSRLLVDSAYSAIERFSFMELDGAGPYYSIVLALEDTQEFRYGVTYVEQLISLVPKFLYADRPPNIAEQFAQMMMKDYFPGAGFGFSPIAEAYINFQYFGFVIQFFFAVLIFSLMWRMFTKYLTRLSPLSVNEIKVLYRVVGFYLLLLIFRSPALFFVKNLVYMFVPICFGALAWSIVKQAR